MKKGEDMKKYLKGFDKIECKHVNESIKSKFLDCFPLGNKLIEGVKFHVDRFMHPLGKIVYCPLRYTHKNKIKHQILMFHYIDQQFPIFIIPIDPNDPTKILEARPRNKSTLSSSIFFYYGWTIYNPSYEGKFHTIISCC
jgi:hypothetical protein